MEPGVGLACYQGAVTIAPALALPVAVVATAVAFALLRDRVVDEPGDRSLHVRRTPRGGGIGPLLAVVVIAVALPAVAPLRWPLVLVAGGFGLLGLAEDVTGVPSRLRLVLQLVLAAVAFPWVLGSMPGSGLGALVLGVGAAVGIVAYANAFNFMDGVNGISAVHVVVVGSAWWLIADGATATAAAVLAWAALGFLPFNAPRAAIFLGDVGSYFFGAALVVVAIGGFHDGIPFEAMAAPLVPYLADTGSTIVRRVRRGEPWHEPHRDHAFQRLVARGWSHAAVAVAVGVVVSTCALLGWASTLGPFPARLAADLGVALVTGAYLRFPGRNP
ncbi:MAG: putative undecaprenyl-phosphate alpha-N-acetylglucosaminyl 1-phosphate transferase [Acidimicrobiales bacterium]|nr:putative undecaprenyl-phosphate alpha-N-acetylglucosaminyl 1-phosphate transferase [Acidimicrobiales bacterium]